MKIEMHYGGGRIGLEVAAGRAVVIGPRGAAVSGGPAGAAAAALGRGAAGFAALAAGRTVGVLLADGTRDLPPEVIGPELLGMLKTAHKVIFFICTGTHTADTPENRTIAHTLQTRTAASGIRPVEIVVHDGRDATFVNAGTTAAGTPIVYNARLAEPEVFCVLSDVKPHYFAGYSNPVKYFVPGLCAFETAEQNHSWTMDPRSRAGVHPWHPEPALRDNPLAADLAEAMETIVRGRPVWALVTLSAEGRIRWADFGPVREVTAAAFLKADAENCFSVAPVHTMVVSPGGLPNDVDLYIAQRALELTESAVADGGEILFLSACPKGVGSPHTQAAFYDTLIRPLEEIADFDRRDYRLFSHKPLRFARLIRRLRKLWVYSQIPAGEIEKMHMAPCRDPQAVIDGWLEENPHEHILFVDGANKLLLRPVVSSPRPSFLLR